MAIKAKVSSRSKNYAGAPLFPHLHKDGMYVATRTRYKADYVRVETQDQLEALVLKGYGARMSNHDIPNAPSFIANKNIELHDGENDLAKTLPKAVEGLDLDIDSSTKRRAEQSLLRAFLLNGRVHAPCVICGRDFPENMLVLLILKKGQNAAYMKNLILVISLHLCAN